MTPRLRQCASRWAMTAVSSNPTSCSKRILAMHLSRWSSTLTEASSTSTVHDDHVSKLRTKSQSQSQHAPSPIASPVLPAALTKVGRPRGRAAVKTITTLDPNRLDSSCYIDLSGVGHTRVWGKLAADDARPCVLLDLFFTSSPPPTAANTYKHRPFPPGTRGFLYYHTDPHDPFESQIRFRITPTADPASFAAGRDLTYGAGLVWHVRLSRLARAPAVRRLLLRDGLVDRALLARVALPGAMDYRIMRAVRGLGRPFLLDFTVEYTLMWVRGAEARRQLVLLQPMRHGRVLLYTGKAQCCFERSMLPEHEGRRVVVLRLLEVVTPLAPIPDPPANADMSMPAEGELFVRHGQVWHRDIDANDTGVSKAFRLLFEEDTSRTS